MPVLEFAHVGLMCKDPIATERFYTRHFGFHRTRVYAPGPEQVVMIKGPGGVYLELFKADENAPSPPPKEAGPSWPCIRHLCFSVASLDEQIKSMGADAKLTLGPLDMGAFVEGMRVCWLSDPDGNIVELNQGYKDENNPPPLENER
jgi:glyoxylase I family protein